jgi:hypothetical protein
MFKLCTAGGEGGNVAAGGTFSLLAKSDLLNYKVCGDVYSLLGML